jgi:HEAT repeat protein
MLRHSAILFLSLLFLTPSSLAQKEGDDKKKKTDQVPEGLKALQNPDARVRYRAAQTLADLGPVAKFAVPDLREALKDKNALVRVKVAEALWKIEKTPNTILLPVLLQALKDKDPGVRAAAPAVIAMLGAKAKSAVAGLTEALQDKEVDVKLAAISALGELGPTAKDSANELLALTSDKEFFLLEPFVGASLASFGPGVVPVLTTALTDKSADRRRVAAYALGTIGSAASSATDALSKLLEHEDAQARQLAARALGKIGPNAKTSIAALEKAFTDKSAGVRIESALATWFITKDAKNVIVLVKALADESPNVRDHACQALATMKADAKSAVPTLAKLLADKDLRLRAVITLGEIGPASAPTLGELKKLAQDKDVETQLHAAFAVWQIDGNANECLAVLEKTLATEAGYSQSIVVLGEMRAAAAPILPTLVSLWREEDVAADRKALAEAIKKIDPMLGKKLGIQ